MTSSAPASSTPGPMYPVALDGAGAAPLPTDVTRTGRPCSSRVSMADTYGAPRGGGTRGHGGTDIHAPRGTHVYAPEGGRLEVADGPTGGIARRLVAGSRTWSLTHLDEGAQPGRVERGALVGRVGTTGSAAGTCPHLHVELRVDGVRINPFSALTEARSRTEAEMASTDSTARQAELVLAQAATVVGRWAASGDAQAEAAARTATSTLVAARAAIPTRPAAALEAGRMVLEVAAAAPPTWSVPPSMVRELRGVLEAAGQTALAAGAGAGVGMGIAILMGLGAAILLLRR